MSGSTWYTADLHLGHRLVSEIRGFDSIADHDQAVLATYASQVRKNDLVFILGDIALNVEFVSLLAKMPGRKRLIWGNHDRGNPMRHDAAKFEPIYRDVCEWAAPFGVKKINGNKVLLSHYPYSGDRGPDRYSQFRLPDLGQTLLHGHTHSDRKQRGYQIHVGWDAWGSLVREDEIERRIVPS